MDLRTSADIAAAFAEITRAIAAADDLEETLSRIAQLAVLTVDGCDDASVTIRERGGRFRTSGPTSDRALDIDRVQYHLAEGPCIAAVIDGIDYDSADLAHDSRWPRFGAKAAELGIRSLVSFHLFAPADAGGAAGAAGSLNLYGAQPAAFGADDRSVGSIYAAYASIAVSAAGSAARIARTETDLRDALASRDIIGQAKGILMERHGLTADEAFDRLRQASQRLNKKLRDVAQDVAETGALPDGDDRS